MPGKTTRSSNLELLRILCMLLIIGDHLTGQSGIADYTTLPSSFAFCLIGCGSRIACSVFVLIGGWFLCEQPYKTRRPLSLWLSLWLYTVPVTLLCKLAGLDVSWGALRWAAFPASTRQLWFISDYLLLLLCVPLLNRLLRGLSRPAHRGLLAVLAVPLIVYPTLFGENGAVSDTAWMFCMSTCSSPTCAAGRTTGWRIFCKTARRRSDSGWGCRCQHDSARCARDTRPD